MPPFFGQSLAHRAVWSVRQITDFFPQKTEADIGGEVSPMKTSKVTPMPTTDPVSRPMELQDFRPLGLEEEIRCRAYQLYEERGKTDGQELADWFQAEGEIMTHQVRQKAS